MDSTFERSYDEPEGIPLKPQERVSVPVDLYHYVPDRCFSAGRIDVSLQAPDATSNVLSFLLEYCAESVPNLVKLAVDDKTDPWIREESIRLLGELPDGPEITLPSDDMTDDARLALTAKNQEVADQFLSRWPTVRMAEPVKAYFESIKLRLE
ncbi:MAG: hypothetical protein KKA42_03075 [candidate division Zixibacteria bacterium]|nr:hypothetical protein [candidate division Zixibacteria bacterium]